jgi:hypothetical protein
MDILVFSLHLQDRSWHWTFFYSSVKSGESCKIELLMRPISFITAAVSVLIAVALPLYRHLLLYEKNAPPRNGKPEASNRSRGESQNRRGVDDVLRNVGISFNLTLCSILFRCYLLPMCPIPISTLWVIHYLDPVYPAFRAISTSSSTSITKPNQILNMQNPQLDLLSCFEYLTCSHLLTINRDVVIWIDLYWFAQDSQNPAGRSHDGDSNRSTKCSSKRFLLPHRSCGNLFPTIWSV